MVKLMTRNAGDNTWMIMNISEVYFDVNDFHNYSYKDLIPEGFSKGYVHDIALAATILCAEGRKQGIPYITEWELDQVAEWVEKINPRICYEVSRSCKEIVTACQPPHALRRMREFLWGFL